MPSDPWGARKGCWADPCPPVLSKAAPICCRVFSLGVIFFGKLQSRHLPAVPQPLLWAFLICRYLVAKFTRDAGMAEQTLLQPLGARDGNHGMCWSSGMCLSIPHAAAVARPVVGGVSREGTATVPVQDILHFRGL